jgi:hypothetical protein
MPPKKDKTPTLAASYVAKCTRCGRKHGPPLNDLCLALLPAEQPEGEPDNEEIEEDQLPLTMSDGLGHSQHDDASAIAEAAAGRDAHEWAVTAQLSNMAASLASLSAMFLETHNDVAQLKEAAAAGGPPQVSVSSVCVPSS